MITKEGDLLQVKAVDVTPELATAWLNLYSQDVQRPPTQSKIDEYAKHMAEGTFLPGSPIRLVVTEDGKTHLLDGRHRLRSVIKSGQAQTFTVTTNASKTENLKRLFRLVNNGKPVTQLEYCLAMGLDQETGLTSTQVNLMLGAASLIYEGFSRAHGIKIDVEEKIPIIRSLALPAIDYFSAINGAVSSTKRQLIWAVTVAVGVLSFGEPALAVGKERIHDFWSGIATLNGNGANDPRSVVFNFFQAYSPPGRTVADKKIVSNAYIARYLSSCLNAWTKGKTIHRVSTNIDKPLTICGHTYEGVNSVR